jgi:hypothetical protein
LCITRWRIIENHRRCSGFFATFGYGKMSLLKVASHESVLKHFTGVKVFEEKNKSSNRRFNPARSLLHGFYLDLSVETSHPIQRNDKISNFSFFHYLSHNQGHILGNVASPDTGSVLWSKAITGCFSFGSPYLIHFNSSRNKLSVEYVIVD